MSRIIVHLDMDAYFASVEQQADPTLRGKPIGVTGKPHEHSIIVAASREGKRFGLKPGMPIWEARRLCPNLLLVSGSAARYIAVTKRFLEILKRYTPMLEVFSIDEVFMDVTQEAARYGGPIPMARLIKAQFQEALGPCITASFGIAHNKTFAKLIANKNKPDGIGEIHQGGLPALLETTPIGEVCGIGPRIERRLNKVGVRVLADLQKIPETYLKREFGVYGLFLKGLGEGIDTTPLVPYTQVPPAKSVGHSKTLPPEVRRFDRALLVLRTLCDQVGRGLRQLGCVARTIYYWFGLTAIGPHCGKQATLPLPTDDGDTIYRTCLAIQHAMGQEPESVFQIGVSARNLMHKATLPGFLLAGDRKRERVNDAVDRIRNRFGEQAIVLGHTLLYDRLPEHVSGYSQMEEWD